MAKDPKNVVFRERHSSRTPPEPPGIYENEADEGSLSPGQEARPGTVDREPARHSGPLAHPESQRSMQIRAQVLHKPDHRKTLRAPVCGVPGTPQTSAGFSPLAQAGLAPLEVGVRPRYAKPDGRGYCTEAPARTRKQAPCFSRSLLGAIGRYTQGDRALQGAIGRYRAL